MPLMIRGKKPPLKSGPIHKIWFFKILPWSIVPQMQEPTPFTLGKNESMTKIEGKFKRSSYLWGRSISPRGPLVPSDFISSLSLGSSKDMNFLRWSIPYLVTFETEKIGTTFVR
jgi:hypothetical protein